MRRRRQMHRSGPGTDQVDGARQGVVDRGGRHGRLASLQRQAGNRAVSALLDGRAPVSVQRVRRKAGNGLLDDLFQLKKRDNAEFIRRTLDGFAFKEWEFSTAGDGNVGSNMISRAVVKGPLSYHINFMLGLAQMDRPAAKEPRLVITLKLLHITARSVAGQDVINQHSSSSSTAAASIHCGPNNDWDLGGGAREDNARELAHQLGLAEPEDLRMPLGNAGYSQASMAALAPRLQHALVSHLEGQLPGYGVTADGDPTWP